MWEPSRQGRLGRLDAHEQLLTAIRNRQSDEARSVMLEHVRTVGAFLEQLADTPLEWR